MILRYAALFVVCCCCFFFSFVFLVLCVRYFVHRLVMCFIVVVFSVVDAADRRTALTPNIPGDAAS